MKAQFALYISETSEKLEYKKKNHGSWDMIFD